MALLIGLATAVGLMAWQQRAAAQRRHGEALFHGRAALAARLPGHAEVLPALASRCSNCHEQANRVPARAASNPSGQNDVRSSRADAGAEALSSYALALTRSALTSLRSRRGGPPTAYDSAAFCQLLRSGEDPARVIIANDMPRYETSNEECHQLWAYLLDR